MPSSPVRVAWTGVSAASTRLAALPSSAALLYLVLRRLQPSRTLAFAVALVYVLLPNYSTDRFWFAAFAAPPFNTF